MDGTAAHVDQVNDGDFAPLVFMLPGSSLIIVVGVFSTSTFRKR